MDKTIKKSGIIIFSVMLAFTLLFGNSIKIYSEESGDASQNNQITEQMQDSVIFIFEGDTLHKNDQDVWEYSANATEEEPLTSEALLALLPTNIVVTVNDVATTLPITWDLTNYGISQYQGEYTVTAQISQEAEFPEGYSHTISVLVKFAAIEEPTTSPEPTDEPSSSVEQITTPETTNEDLTSSNDTNEQLTTNAEIAPLAISDHIVQGVSPSNVKINLFDYWADSQYNTDQGYNVSNVDGDYRRDNASYYNDFFNNQKTYFSSYSNYDATNIDLGINAKKTLKFGLWGPGDLNGNSTNIKQGIVENKLNSEGFPSLSTTYIEGTSTIGAFPDYSNATDQDLSLSYLFNESDIENAKKAYTNVEGLLQLNSDGYYYYDSKENFASFDGSKNFILYDGKAVMQEKGQFFPFNSAEEIFKEVDGNLVNGDNIEAGDWRTKSNILNHYFGLSMETTFQQPANGLVSNGYSQIPMKFEFSGDDDVWIYIDGVLVSDLGGIHAAVETEIDFNTGVVKVNGSQTGTLKSIFEAAQVTGEFIGNTFAAGTTHNLKMFYLERGNSESNLKLKFNSLEAEPDKIIKVDQAGNPLSNVVFDLYETGSDYVVAEGQTPIGHFVTDINGEAVLNDGQFSFVEGKYYVLRESDTPDGYISIGDIKIKYSNENASNQLVVENQWETGVSASFVANVSNTGQNLQYQSYNNSAMIDNTAAKNGLVVMVPMVNYEYDANVTTKGIWEPLYGTVLTGFNKITPTSEYDADQRNASIDAFINQIKYSNYIEDHWYLEWSEEKHRFVGTMKDLPGTQDDYIFVNPTEGNLIMAYYFIDGSAFGNDSSLTAEQKIKMLKAKEETDIKKLFGNGDSATDSTFRLLNMNTFQRLFNSRIYIPNALRELNVIKKDENGKAMANAVIGLYDSTKNQLVAKGITNSNGELVFSAEGADEMPTDDNLKSSVKYALETNPDGSDKKYYLKEISAPSGYYVNPTKVPIVVTKDSVYADAGTETDDISVRKGLGYLVQTMVQYATEDDIDVTLRDITISEYILPTGEFKPWNTGNSTWSSTNRTIDLHYGLNTNRVFDYGVHDPNGSPYFEVNSGWMGFSVKQNLNAHEGDSTYKDVNKTDLTGRNITDLFTGATGVVITNQPITDLTIEKVITSNITIDTREFSFTLEAKDSNGKSITGNYTTTLKNGTSSSITFESGKATLKIEASSSDSGSIIIHGLPKGTTYTVTEQGPFIEFLPSVTIDDKSSPNGTTASDSLLVTDTDNNLIDKVVFTNDFNTSSMSFTKTDANGNPLSGAGFDLYILNCQDTTHDHANKLVEEYPNCWAKVGSTENSQTDGKVTLSGLLEVSSYLYRLVEVKASSGYVLPKDQWNIKYDGTKFVFIESTGSNLPGVETSNGTYIIRNYKPGELPLTGGDGITPLFYLTGVAIMLVGGIVLVLRYRRRIS